MTTVTPVSQTLDPELQAVAKAMADGRERTTNDIIRDAKLKASTRRVSELTKKLVKMRILERFEPVTDFPTWKLRPEKEGE